MAKQHREETTSSATKPSAKATRSADQFRVGNVRGYLRGSVWYLYYHEQGQRRVGPDKAVAKQMAAQINGQLGIGAPSSLSFESISIAELRERWLTRHEHVLRSSIQTIRRYRTATEHLMRFDGRKLRPNWAKENAKVDVEYFRQPGATMDAAVGYFGKSDAWIRRALTFAKATAVSTEEKTAE